MNHMSRKPSRMQVIYSKSLPLFWIVVDKKIMFWNNMFQNKNCNKLSTKPNIIKIKENNWCWHILFWNTLIWIWHGIFHMEYFITIYSMYNFFFFFNKFFFEQTYINIVTARIEIIWVTQKRNISLWRHLPKINQLYQNNSQVAASVYAHN